MDKQEIFGLIDYICIMYDYGFDIEDQEQEIKDIISNIDIEELVNYCKKNNRMNFFKNISDKLYLTKTRSKKTYLEELIDNRVEIIFKHPINNQEIIDTLIKKNRIDLLYNIDINILFKSESYFDLMVEDHKKGIDVHFEKMSFNYHEHSSYLTALELIKMAQNDLINFVPKISSDMLLYKGKTDKKSVLEYLLEMDRDITISKIINNCEDKFNHQLGIKLRLLNINSIPIDIKNNAKPYGYEYIMDTNTKYDKECQNNYEELLLELKALFYNDGKSNHDLIDTLITSYRYLLSKNEELFIKEVKQLIAIKKRNINSFTYQKNIIKSHFSKKNGIYITHNTIGTINHETSHALHYYLTNNYIPHNIFEAINRVKKNKEILKRIKDYSDKYNKIKNQIKSKISSYEISNYYDQLYQDEEILNLYTFLTNTKSDIKEKLIKDYNEQILDTILSKTYSIDEFLSQKKEIEVQEFTSIVLQNDYYSFAAISDIIDAIFQGKFKNGVLTDENGEFFDKSPGHGIYYYEKQSKCFMEMIADYGSIIKSKESEEMIKYLRWIVGDEIVDILKNIYEEIIINSDVLTYEEEEHVK